MSDTLDRLLDAVSEQRLPLPDAGQVSAPIGARPLLLARLATASPLLVIGPRASATPERAREIDLFLQGQGVCHIPPLFEAPVLQIPPHPEAEVERVKGLMQCLDGSARVALVDWKSFITPVDRPLGLIDRIKHMRVGDTIERADLQETLHSLGYMREDLTTSAGDYSFRGAVVDVFSPYHDEPVRIEFEDDTIISLRHFDPFTQLSHERIEEVSLIPLHEAREAEATIDDYLPGFRIVVEEPDQISREIEQWKEGLQAQIDVAVDVGSHEAGSPLLPKLIAGIARLESVIASSPLSFQELSTTGADTGMRQQRAFEGLIEEWVKEAKRKTESGRAVAVFLQSKGLGDRLGELLGERHVAVSSKLDPGAVTLAAGLLQKGFEWPAGGLDVYSETDIFGPLPSAPAHSRRKAAAAFQSDLRDLRPGDFVTHVLNGIGVFRGLVKVGLEGAEQEFMHLEYDGGDKLYVPVERMDLVEKYRASGGGSDPRLDRLGGTGWEKSKKRVRKAVEEMALELLNLYAERRLAHRPGYGSDTAWQKEFEEAFEFEPTEDQAGAIVDVKADLERQQPMDRLICGDVGFGKTEVAMRAAMKVVTEGRQVAVLAPTTVLAYQHWRTFSRRFEAFPIRIDLLSRFRTKAEQARTVADIAAGAVDIVIGTHRLLSKDVQFKNLGLLVVDEEQRFGVTHKERLKQMKKNVDVLALSATPIPRTLQMSIAGIRDMSVIETPPRDRLAIHTQVLPFDQKVIQAAVRFEIGRSGQVFFVCNRIQSMPALARFLAGLCPEAKVSIAHGQMSEGELEERMQEFVDGKTNLMLATSIIENGLDIPRVNTLIVNRADHFGLSQLYQLRGRVGRSSRRAYAYLLVPPESVLTELARKRLAALREFTELGAGFRIAAMDLELRGAGSLLGHRQHGHIEAVGFDMYCRMLEKAVEELRGGHAVEEEEEPLTISLGLDIRIPEHYIPDTNQRLQVYKRVSSARGEQDLARMRDELKDRYGSLPVELESLFLYGSIKAAATSAGLRAIERKGGEIHMRFPEKPRHSPERIIETSRALGGRLLPGGVVAIPATDDMKKQSLEFLERLRQDG